MQTQIELKQAVDAAKSALPTNIRSYIDKIIQYDTAQSRFNLISSQ